MAGGFRVDWPIPMSFIVKGMELGRERFLSNLGTNLGSAASQIESYARGNHVWQNRTGDAESLFTVKMEGGHSVMVLEHGVPYGKYLESMQGGRFAILLPSFTYGKPIIQTELTRSLEAYRS